MKSYVRHIALVVPDLREAESYYQSLFQMELIGREAEMEDGLWYTLPRDKGWEDAEAGGIDLDMLALRKGDIVLALFQGSNPLGQVFAIGLAMPREQVDEVRKQVSPEVDVTRDREGHFHFRDRYGILWQLVPPRDEFLMNGEVSGRWLEV